jgi:two-component system sensor histidine kinase DesK
LLVSDAVLASGALEEAKHLIDVALASTRQIAFGEQVIRLDAELANAASLLEAAGIDVEIESLAAPESEVRELFGRLIREATTNVFRHAQAGAVRITISPSSIQISNDGAPAEAGELSGLATLRDRFIESGGDLEVVAHEGIFTVRGTTA